MDEVKGQCHVGGKKMCKCARKIILARNLLHQAEARSWVPFRILVPQGTGNMSSADHAVIQPRDR